MEMSVNEATTRITKLILIETKPIKKVYSRAYTLNANNETLNNLHHVLHSNQSKGYHSYRGGLSDLDVAIRLPNIINFDPTPTPIDIPHGWDTRRGRFLLEATTTMGYITYVTYLQGYTDYLDMSYTGQLDPQMTLIVNSIIYVSIQRDPVTNQIKTSNLDFYNVIPNSSGNVEYLEELSDHGVVKKLIRPEDIMGSLFITERTSMDGGFSVDSTDNLEINKVSRRKNNEMFKYFSTITNSFIDGKNVSENNNDRLDIFHNAAAAVAEPDITKNPFIRCIWKHTGRFNINRLSLGLLKDIDPSMRPVFVSRQSEVQPVTGQPMFMDTEDTASTLQPTQEVLKATIISSMLPSFMCDEMITSLSISLTNQTGENIALVSDMRTFIETIEPTLQINRIISKVSTILMPKLSDNGYTRFEIFVTADILGDITVAISLDMQPMQIFRFPCYADSLYSPVITDKHKKDILLTEFQNVLEQTY